MNLKEQAEDLAKKLQGNHFEFSSFIWYDEPANSGKWCIIYTHNRDSDLLEQSNAAVIARTLEVPEFAADVRPARHSHWAVGWVDGYAIRVRDADYNITPAFLAYTELRTAMEDYPLLDEEDHSRREYEASVENIANEGRGLVSDAAPESWPGEVFSWLYENDQRAVENTDGNGGYPSSESVGAALKALGYSQEES